MLAWVLVLAVDASAGSSSSVERNNHVTVQAFSDREAIEPGSELSLLVSVKPDKDWHVYWQNPGGTGFPTKVKWKAPGGFKVGPTQYPVPLRHFDKELEETSFILEGESFFLTSVHVPGDASGEVALTAEVSWLACKKECIPGDAKVTLLLKVADKGATAKPANEKLFERARGALPEPLSAAQYVKISGKLSREKLKPGDDATASLQIEIEPKHHMQSNKPVQEEMIPTVLFLELTDGLEFGEVEYPRGHEREDKILGKLSEYSGKIEIKAPVIVSEDADKAPRTIRGVLQYQICTDSGTCYPPQYIGVSIPVQMEGGEKAAATSAVGPAGTVSQSTEAHAEGTTEATSDSRGLDAIQGWFISKGFYGVLLLAVLGGVILNLMPCVLPVISLKILSFVRQAHEDRARIMMLGLSYCAGILTFFGIIAVLFAKTGAGWGEHFQRPLVILILAAVVTAFALSLFGVFAVFTPKVVNKLGEKAESREGLPSAFFTGVLATVLGTACTAPFLSAAIGAASKYPAEQGAWIFMAVGFGMALPFLVLAANPAWLKFVPKPGKWMGTFESLMGFLLLGTVVWLLYPLGEQLGAWGLLLTMMFLLGVSIAVWLKGKVQFNDPLERRLAMNFFALVVLAAAWLVPFQWVSTLEKLEAAQGDEAKLIAMAERIRLTGGNSGLTDVQWDESRWDVTDGDIPWVPYDQQLVAQYVDAGYTVFVDFTAAWCASCKANLKSSIDIDRTKQVMRELGVVPFEADYTRKDKEIKEILASYGRAGVPLYLVFRPNETDSPKILPELLTPDIVIDALKEAGPSKAGQELAAAQKK